MIRCCATVAGVDGGRGGGGGKGSMHVQFAHVVDVHWAPETQQHPLSRGVSMVLYSYSTVQLMFLQTGGENGGVDGTGGGEGGGEGGAGDDGKGCSGDGLGGTAGGGGGSGCGGGGNDGGDRETRSSTGSVSTAVTEVRLLSRSTTRGIGTVTGTRTRTRTRMLPGRMSTIEMYDASIPRYAPSSSKNCC